MTALIVIAVLVVAVVVVAPWLRRARHDRRTAREYHRMLETLSHLNPERSGSLSGAGLVPPAPHPVSPAAHPDPSGVLALRQATYPAPPGTGDPPEVPAGPPAAEPSARSVRLPGGAPPDFGLLGGRAPVVGPRRRGSAQMLAVMMAVVALAVGGAVGVVVITSHHGAGAGAGADSAAVRRPAAADSGRKPRGLDIATPKVPPTSPSTTPVTVAPFTLVSNVGDTSVYQLVGNTPITLHAEGECWVAIHRTNATGPSVYTALMTPGQTETVSAPVWIRLGAPAAVAVAVNGSPLPAAGTGADPYDLELQ